MNDREPVGHPRSGEAVVLELELPARMESVGPVHDLLGELWNNGIRVTAEERSQFETAVAEVAANIIEHAAAGRDVVMHLRLTLSPDWLEAVFTDTGVAADVDLNAAEMPEELAESGRGLALTRAVTDEVAYERIGERNRWRLTRRHSAHGGVRGGNDANGTS